MKQTIRLVDLKFRAYHGLYEEEKVLGNSFVVNLEIVTNIERHTDVSLNHSIDYTQLYEIVEARMHQPTELLEQVVLNIIADCQDRFAQMEGIKVSLKKLSPPFGGNCQAAEITIEA